MDKKLRLLLFKDCNRSCVGCCNEDWDLDDLEQESNFKWYDEILLTGGEPMLKPEIVFETVFKIKESSDAKIYLYTAKIDNVNQLSGILNFIDGITVTLHSEEDVEYFEELDKFLWSNQSYYASRKSFRLNVFKGISIGCLSKLWEVKRDIEWVKDCPLPENEVFKKLAGEYDG